MPFSCCSQAFAILFLCQHSQILYTAIHCPFFRLGEPVYRQMLFFLLAKGTPRLLGALIYRGLDSLGKDKREYYVRKNRRKKERKFLEGQVFKETVSHYYYVERVYVKLKGRPCT